MLAALLLNAQALAAYPNDVVLSSMVEWNGTTVTEPEIVSAAYQQLVLELGAAIANKPTAPANTLGVNGFDVGVSSSFSFVGAAGDTTEPSPWMRAHETGDPSPVVWVPGLELRKGLPLSLEVGTRAGYVGASNQMVAGAWGRAGLIEGYRQAPDLSLQVGYSGYLGNDELELGVLDWSFTLGYQLPFGRLKGINDAVFAPYAGLGQLRIHASPLLDEDVADTLGITPLTGFDPTGDGYMDQLRPLQLHGGVRIQKGAFRFLTAVTASPKIVPTVTTGLGFTF